MEKFKGFPDIGEEYCEGIREPLPEDVFGDTAPPGFGTGDHFTPWPPATKNEGGQPPFIAVAGTPSDVIAIHLFPLIPEHPAPILSVDLFPQKTERRAPILLVNDLIPTQTFRRKAEKNLRRGGRHTAEHR